MFREVVKVISFERNTPTNNNTKPTILHKRFSISDFRATIIDGSLRLEDILSIAHVVLRTKIFSHAPIPLYYVEIRKQSKALTFKTL